MAEVPKSIGGLSETAITEETAKDFKMNLSFHTETTLDVISERGSLKLSDLKSRGLSAKDLLEFHRIKVSFDGAVVPSAEAAKFKPITRR